MVTVVRRAVPKALLLAVLFGLALMHTFGHAAHGGPHPATRAVHAAAFGDQDATPQPCHDCGGHSAWHAFSVCLAVLSALIILAVAVLRLRQRPVRTPSPRAFAAALAVSRGPPTAVPVRIRLAMLSVSRT
ncbi:DUF6153 family protein [Catellatospora tritici]|uniref:DUF6153 family protein n=1 Tax=Catellatospora tritici TaxID=2851566 RepID=UPI001C2D0C4C|nr:DUF6153 family protein [Catellatospora tritici]MBV1854301.1 hypothetical protein [Catellatospora tritici]